MPGVPGDQTHPAYTERSLRLPNLGALLTSPDQLMKTLTGWGTADFDGTQLIARLSTSLNLFGLNSQVVIQGPPNALDAWLVSITTNPPGLLARLKYSLPDGFAITMPLSTLWSVQASISGSFDAVLQAARLRRTSRSRRRPAP
jgi:hypothetical protein